MLRQVASRYMTSTHERLGQIQGTEFQSVPERATHRRAGPGAGAFRSVITIMLQSHWCLQRLMVPLIAVAILDSVVHIIEVCRQRGSLSRFSQRTMQGFSGLDRKPSQDSWAS